MSVVKFRNKWRAVISNGRDPSTGKQIRITKVFDTKKEAMLYEADMTKKIKTKFPTGYGITSMTLNEFYEYFKKNYEKILTPKTLESYDASYIRISAAIGNIPLAKIETAHILSFYRQLDTCSRLNGQKGTLSARTKRKHHELLSRVFKKALQWRFLLVNPMDGIDPPKWRYKNNTEIPDKDELAKLFSALENETLKHKVWIMLTFSTGIRRGELFGIRWNDIDFEEKTLSIQRSMSNVNHEVTAKETKTPSSTRVISLSDTIVTMLKEYRIEYEAYYQQIVNTNIFEGVGRIKDEYIFITHTGRVSHPDAFNNYLKAMTKRYGLMNITPHTLRHCSASYLIANNVDIQTVAARLGHASTAVTQTVYSHLLKSVERETADVMEQIIQKNHITNKETK